MNKYLESTKKAMDTLGKEDDIIFLGQTVVYSGSPMFNSLVDVPISKRIEMPVAEDMQMGISIGLSLEGFIPVSIYPRVDFLILAVNQLVNHLDKIKEMSHGEFSPGVIIRTQIGNTKPLDPGPQHHGNYYQGLKAMCKNIKIIKLTRTKNIVKEYIDALDRARNGESTILIETPQGGKNPNKR